MAINSINNKNYPTLEEVETDGLLKLQTDLLKGNVTLRHAIHPLLDKGNFNQVEKMFAPVFNKLSEQILCIDSEGNITFCNEQAADYFNFPVNTLIGLHINQIVTIGDPFFCLIETLQTGKEIKNRDFFHERLYHINTYIHWNNNKIERIIAVLSNKYEYNEVDKYELTKRISSSIAHEIRNPLTTVRGYLQVIQEKVDTDTAELISNLLLKEIDSVNQLISDFLTVTNSDNSKEELIAFHHFIHHDLHHIVLPYTNDPNIRITIDSTHITTDTIVGNKEELLKVFTHLIQNSIEAKTIHPLDIKIKVCKVYNYIKFIISDNGTGIDTKYLANIFDPFFTTKDASKGLGLSISKKIIENHDGFITVESHKGKTFFYVYLPISSL